MPASANATDAGSLNTPVSIEKPKVPETRTASGGVVKEWEIFAPLVWSGWRQSKRGNEAPAANAYSPENFYTVRIHPLPGLTTDMRIVDGDRTFDILSVNDRSAPGSTVLEVKEGRSKGN